MALMPKKNAGLTDQLSQKEFGIVKMRIDEDARDRFRNSMVAARRQFKSLKFTRKDAEMALAGIRE